MTVGRIKVKNIDEFNRALTEFGRDLVPEAHLQFQTKIALEVLKRIVLKTPVGNPDKWAPSSLPPPPGYVGGRARGNWQLSRTPTDQVVEGTDAGGGDTVLAGAVAATKLTRPFGTIWIFNNVRYINRLEDGWSSQAPTGMVGLSLAEVEAAF